MALDTGSEHGIRSDINVTPLIDVVLVLLLLSMVLTPLGSRSYDVTLPERSAAPPGSPLALVFVHVDRDGRIEVQGTAVEGGLLRERLEELLARTSDRRVLFRCADAAPYPQALGAMDSVRAAGGIVAIERQEPAS